MNLTDLILILVLIFIAFIGASRGFFKSLAGVAATAAAAIVAKIAAFPVAGAIYEKFFRESVVSALNGVFPSGTVEGEIGSAVSKAAESVPGYIGSVLNYFSANISATAESALSVTDIESVYISPIAVKVLSWIAAVLIFVLCGLLLRLILSALDKILFKRKNPGIISFANKLLGFLLGTVKGVLVILAVCLILNFTAPLFGKNAFTDNISASAICSYVSQIF